MAKITKNAEIVYDLRLNERELKILTLAVGRISQQEMEIAWSSRNYKGKVTTDEMYALFSVLEKQTKEADKGDS